MNHVSRLKSASTCLLLLLASGLTASAQYFQTKRPAKKKGVAIGIKAEYHTYDLYVDGRVDRYSIKNWAGVQNAGEGWRLGIFGRTSGQKWYLQPELTYFYGTTFVGFFNHEPLDNATPPTGQYDWIRSEGGGKHRRIDAAAIGGIRLAKYVHLQAGPVLSHHFRDRFYPRTMVNRNDQILSDFNHSYHPFFLSGRLGIGAELGPVLLTFSHERTLTPMASNVEYLGKKYPLKQSSRLVQLSLALRLYRWKVPNNE